MFKIKLGSNFKVRTKQLKIKRNKHSINLLPSFPLFQILQRHRAPGGGRHRRHGKPPNAAPLLARITRPVLVARVRLCSINGQPGQQHAATAQTAALLQGSAPSSGWGSSGAGICASRSGPGPDELGYPVCEGFVGTKSFVFNFWAAIFDFM